MSAGVGDRLSNSFDIPAQVLFASLKIELGAAMQARIETS